MDLDRTDRLLDQLGARSPGAISHDDEITASLAAWTRQIDAALPSAPGTSRHRRRLGRALAGGALALATLMGSSAAAALTGTEIPALSDVGRVVVAWMPGLDPVRDRGSGAVDAGTDSGRPRGEAGGPSTRQPVDTPMPGAAPAVDAVPAQAAPAQAAPAASSPAALPGDQEPPARPEGPLAGAEARTGRSYRAVASSIPAPAELDRSDGGTGAAAAPPAPLPGRGGSAGPVTRPGASERGTGGGREDADAPPTAQPQASGARAHRAPAASPSRNASPPAEGAASEDTSSSSPSKEASPFTTAPPSGTVAPSNVTGPTSAPQPARATGTDPATLPSSASDRAQDAVVPTPAGAPATPREVVPVGPVGHGDERRPDR